MRDFICPRCGQHLAFENSKCLSCGSRLAFSLEHGTMVVIGDSGACANVDIAACNWFADSPSGAGVLCASCRLTRTRPNDADTAGMVQFATAERAKRRLIAELAELKLPIVGRSEDPDFGLAFDLLSSTHEQVLTGHENGVITMDLAEVDDAYREQLRIAMDEPYRTLLGHLRHETGHAYFHRLVGASASQVTNFHALFGDPDADYQAALDRHYAGGAAPAWKDSYVSAYAAMHPAEDWAETFAHYLHIRDTLDTAAAFGLAPANAAFGQKLLGASAFDAIIGMWLPLAWSLNMVNRSMGRDDLYPFVLPVPVLQKMRFIHTAVEELSREVDTAA
jgi:hypothetical protein